MSAIFKKYVFPIAILVVIGFSGCTSVSKDEPKDKKDITKRIVTSVDKKTTSISTSNVSSTNSMAALKREVGLVIPKAKISKKMKIFTTMIDGVYMEVLAVMGTDGKIRTTLNTSNVCYDSGSGYFNQVGDQLQCNNCKNKYLIDSIGNEAIGCSPVPIPATEKEDLEDKIVVYKDFLKKNSKLFLKLRRIDIQ